MLDASQVAALLVELGRRTALAGDNYFRAKAYQRAADTLSALVEPLDRVIAENRLRELPGHRRDDRRHHHEVAQNWHATRCSKSCAGAYPRACSKCSRSRGSSRRRSTFFTRSLGSPIWARLRPPPARTG